MSDEKLKENIGGINNALSKIKKIKGVKYDYKKGFLNSPIDSLNKYSSSYSLKNQFGFIAQQIDSVVPEVVVYDSIHKNYGVSYENLIPVIVEAIKEQQLQIDSLKQLVNKKNPGTLKNAKEIYSVEEAGSEKTSSLEQNSPNPFNQNTTIAYYLPETIKNAAIYIYNMQGNQIKVIPVNANGNGSITIYGSELRPGMYLYSLIADGKEVDTKRMILTE
jgi:hypothetical protein